MSSRRETWARLICDAGGAGRYLLPGRDLELNPTLADYGEVDLQAFLERLNDKGGSVDLLASVYWLSQPQIQAFIFKDLPVLIRSLGHGSHASPPAVEPTFKGRVLWQETLMGRLSGAVPRGRYLVSHVERSADIPENRLLKLFLTNIVAVSGEMAWRGAGALPTRFRSLRDVAERALSNTHLQGVTLEHCLTARMLNTAARHRNHRYSRLATLARDYEASVARGKWGQILELLRKGWLAPVTSEDLFELYALVLVLQTLEAGLGLGIPVSYGLIQPGRAAVATFHDTSRQLRVEVFFDQSPIGIFGCSSEYLSTLVAHHGLVAQERRPDIFVRFMSPAGERRLMIEVKESEDPH